MRQKPLSVPSNPIRRIKRRGSSGLHQLPIRVRCQVFANPEYILNICRTNASSDLIKAGIRMIFQKAHNLQLQSNDRIRSFLSRLNTRLMASINVNERAIESHGALENGD